MTGSPIEKDVIFTKDLNEMITSIVEGVLELDATQRGESNNAQRELLQSFSVGLSSNGH